MIGNVVECDNKLYFHNEDKVLYVENAWKGSDGAFHLVYGWYISPIPLLLERMHEVDIKDEKTCHIIREL
jgi:hypothetical protein